MPQHYNHYNLSSLHAAFLTFSIVTTLKKTDKQIVIQMSE